MEKLEYMAVALKSFLISLTSTETHPSHTTLFLSIILKVFSHYLLRFAFELGTRFHSFSRHPKDRFLFLQMPLKVCLHCNLSPRPKLFSRSNLLTLFVAFIQTYTQVQTEDKQSQELPEVEPEQGQQG